MTFGEAIEALKKERHGRYIRTVCKGEIFEPLIYKDIDRGRVECGFVAWHARDVDILADDWEPGACLERQIQ